MEEVTCLLCGHDEHRVRYRGRDLLCDLPGEFKLVECSRCGFLYLCPRPGKSEIARHYPDDYGAYNAWDEEESGAFRAARQDDIDRRCAVVLQRKTHGDLLDIGTATGDFLATIRERGAWNVRGIEPQQTAAEHARQAYGLTVDDGYLESAPYEARSFDVITMWEVLEHVPQPMDTLRRVYDLLRPGGILVLSMPNRDSLDAKLFGEYWIGLDLPRHMSVFSRKDIATAVMSAGFECPEVFSCSGRLGGAHTEFLCIMLSVSFFLKGNGPQSRLRRTAQRVFDECTRSAVLVPLFLLTLPYSRITRMLNRSTQMTVVARKPGSIGH